MKNLNLAAATATLAAAAALTPSAALACGGCFNMNPPPPPGQQDQQYVVQSSERVLFARDDKTGTSTVWVEVRYTGLASEFGWVLPLPKQPKVGVGTRWLFNKLDKALAPQFKTSFAGMENCRDPLEGCLLPPATPQDAGATYGGADVALASDAPGGTGGMDETVKVLDQGATGPYDYAVIAAKNADPLNTWLNSHGYKTPAKATPILQSHIAKGDVFVAIKLSNGAGVEQIRPIVLTMDNAEPCVPLRLTSIAAAEEMTVAVTLAGKGRAIPKNALHVQINPLRLNWFNGAGNYPQLVSAALDEAAGNAFVTEAAGNPKGIIDPLFSPNGIIDPLFMPQTQENLGKVGTNKALGVWAGSLNLDTVDELADDIEAVTLFGKAHKLSAAQALAVLRYCAVPKGQWAGGDAISSQEWGTDDCKANVNGTYVTIPAAEANAKLDGAALLAKAKEGFFGPLETAKSALGGAGKVTRLLMRISPEEMDRDPVFAFNAELPDVSSLHTATFTGVCPTGWLPATQTRLSVDGFGSWIFDGIPPNNFSSQFSGNVGNNATDAKFKNAPAALAIEAMEETGAPVVVDPSQAGVVSAAIAGSLPGKPTLPKDLVVKKGAPWPLPASDAKATKLGGWPKPPFCEAKQGWQDGKLPPDGQPPKPDADNPDASAGSETAPSDSATAKDAGSTSNPDSGSNGAETNAIQDGGVTASLDSGSTGTTTTAPAKSSGSSCSGSPATASWGWLGALLAVAFVWARRK